MITAICDCKKCGGELIIEYGVISCLQCSAPHDAEGNLQPTRDPVAEGITNVSDKRFGGYGGHHNPIRRSW